MTQTTERKNKRGSDDSRDTYDMRPSTRQRPENIKGPDGEVDNDEKSDGGPEETKFEVRRKLTGCYITWTKTMSGI